MDLAEQLTSLNYLSATRYSSLAAVVLLVYDYFLCFPDELVYIWGSRCRWNLGKVLYILNRFVPTFNLLIQVHTYINHSLSESFCRNWFYVDVSLSWVSLGFVEWLLTVRTIAIYEKSRPVTVFLVALGISTMVAMAVLLILISIRIQDVSIPSSFRPFVSGCLYKEKPNLIGGVFICPLVFESAVCFATLKKALQHWYTRTLRHSPLFQTLYYDGFMYFLIIFAIAITNLLTWYLVPAALGMLVIMMYRVSMCVMSCRIILHLRKAGAKLGNGARESIVLKESWNWAGGEELAISTLTPQALMPKENPEPEAPP